MMVMIFIACYNMCLSYILGTVYQKYEPIFFQSIGNPFIFRCLDGVLIDGNDKGISKVVYKGMLLSERSQFGKGCIIYKVQLYDILEKAKLWRL